MQINLPRGRRLALALGLWTSACGGNTAQQPPAATPPASPTPSAERNLNATEIDAVLQRELPGLPAHSIATPDGSTRLSLRGTANGPMSPVPDSDVYEASSRIGEEPMRCVVYPDRRDAASLLQTLAKLTVERMERYEFQSVTANMVAGRPYLLAAVLYNATVNGRRVLGDIKLAAGTTDGGSLACVLDSPGLRQTFLDAFRLGLESLDTPGIRATPKPHYEEIAISTLDGLMTGFDQTLEHVSGKEHTTYVYSSSLSRVQGGGIATSDGVTITRSRDGIVQESHNVNADNGEIERNLTLTARGNGRYDVSGTLQGKNHSATFTVTGGIPDDHSDAKRLLALTRAQPGTQTELVGFIPAVNPSAATTQQATRLPAGERFPLSLRIGSMEIQMQVDAHGRAETGELLLGSRRAAIARVYERGEP